MPRADQLDEVRAPCCMGLLRLLSACTLLQTGTLVLRRLAGWRPALAAAPAHLAVLGALQYGPRCRAADRRLTAAPHAPQLLEDDPRFEDTEEDGEEAAPGANHAPPPPHQACALAARPV